MNPCIVVDIETMAQCADAAVCSIGAAAFDKASGQILGEYSATVDLADSMAAGLKVDAGTIKWWMEQSRDARRAIFDMPTSLLSSLVGLATFVGDFSGEGFEIWCNGASFDFAILESAFRAVRLTLPWHFWDERDQRTILALARDLTGYEKPANPDTAHRALDDARHSARIISECYRALSALKGD